MSHRFSYQCVAGFLLVALAGCVSIPGPFSRHTPARLPSELERYYDYTRNDLKSTLVSTREKSGYRIERLQLTPIEQSGSDVQPITLDWYRPSRPGQLPVVLFSPILAGNDLYVREFVGFFAARGIQAVIVYRPKETFSPERDLKDLENHFHESVIQMRRVIDWLEKQDSVDSEQIGSYGISLGGILTTILAAVEPRVKASVFGLPAGHVPEIIMTSGDKTIRKRRRAYLKSHGWSDAQGLEELKKVLVSEPLRLAPSIDPDRALAIGGLFDRVLGFGRTLDLWRSMGRPQLIVLPTGHYSAVLATPYLKMVTYSFFRRHLHR